MCDGRKQALELSHSNTAKTTKELSIEPKDVEHDDRLTLGDSHEGDEEASDFRVSSEAEGDDTLNHSANNKDASTYLQQLDAQNNGDRDDSKFTQINSLARSENSMAYQKRHESGEEVLQVRSSKHVGDFHKHREENVRTRRDNYDRDGRRKIDQNKSRAKEVVHPSYAHKDLDSGSGHTLRGRIEGFGRKLTSHLVVGGGEMTKTMLEK
ncbi:hypothetical protein HPP92_020178 [Vanilla planifolia]|uniref:Uncharacterized protein n=1 Tax=Vanilla planifolia TaxID=51239 RepID=A0A835Q4G9_VANPL|nr:hypothetical protein HPP92_020617 [Vanilla planifolia]KAG0466014.1 hypothetical protein HPP92_020178 [Vanilla planifolia]